MRFPQERWLGEVSARRGSARPLTEVGLPNHRVLPLELPSIGAQAKAQMRDGASKANGEGV